MRFIIIVVFFLFFFEFHSQGQKQFKLGDKPSHILSTSVLELESSNRGFQLPRLTTTQANGILAAAKTNNASGLMIYNLDCKCIQVFDANTTSGQWVNLSTSSPVNTFWALSGNSGSSPTLHYIGTSDNTDFVMRTNSMERIRIKNSGETQFANQVIQNFSAKINEQTTTNYTLSLNDNGTVLLLNNSNPINLSIPNLLPVGFNVTVYQMGTGTVSFSPAVGLSLLQRSNAFSTSGQYASASILIPKAGMALLTGDLN